MKDTQREQVREYLKKHKAITQRKASEQFGCDNLAARIFELRTELSIETVMIQVANRFGRICRVAEYRI